MPQSLDGWFACVRFGCPLQEKHIKVRDRIIEDGAEYGHRIQPICRECRHDLKMIGRPPE